jgi:Tfp pilus assembly protein PilO
MTRSIISLLCVAGAIALFFFYTKPAYDGLQAEREKIVQYDLGLDKAAELQGRKQALLSRYNAFNPNDVERLHKLLPDHVDNVRLVLDLDTLASSRGLALQNVVINAATGLDTEDAVAAIGPTDVTHGSLTLTFATTGTYERFVDFLADLERSLRIVDVISLKMSNASQGSGGEPIYRFDITLRTYWLK